MSRLVELTLPDFGDEPALPLISLAEYDARLNDTVNCMARCAAATGAPGWIPASALCVVDSFSTPHLASGVR